MLKKAYILSYLFFLATLLMGQTNSQAPLAINLAGIASWSTEMPFVDAMKMSRNWISQCVGCPWGTGSNLPVDANGYVTSLPVDHWAETLMLDGNPANPIGTYNLYYEGEGTFDFFGSDVLSFTEIGPGHIQVEVGEGISGIWLRIMETDPNTTGNHLRNIRFIMPGYENTYQTEPFYPPFLETWKDFSTIRFMDWGHTNNNPMTSWSERTRPNHATQSRAEGVAVEYMVQLCNTLQTNAWVCLPHQADDDYVTQLATYWRDNLDPNLKIYIEYSNEVWNGIFEQAGYASTQGGILGLGTNSYEDQVYYYAHRSVEIFNIFETVFGGLSRLERVIAWQNFNTYWSPLLLDYNNTYQSTDAFAIAPYFGGSLGDPSTQDAVAAMTTDEILDICEDELASNMDGCRQQAEIANARGLSLIAYEGGQHLVGYLGAENNVALEMALQTANRDPRMQDIYLEYYNRWKEAGGELFAVFSSMGTPSKWGSWGLLENFAEDFCDKPKYVSSTQFNLLHTPAWWLNPEAPPTFQGDQLINFDASTLSGVSQNRSFTTNTNDQIIPMSDANGDHLFDTGDNQSEFYGGVQMDFGTEPLGSTNYSLSSTQFYMEAGTGQGAFSDLDGLFLWKKEQFLNGYDAGTNVSVGKLVCNVTNFVGDNNAEFRFVIKDNGNYYISDFMKTAGQDLLELDLFNNSEVPGKRWYLFDPTANDFDIPTLLVAPVPLAFNNVEAVGFAVHAHREYHTGFGFDRFEVYTRAVEEFTVSLNQNSSQADPTALQSILYTAVFSEPTTDFTASDVVIEGSATDVGTTALVTEIAPMDGTTYQIAIENLVQNGLIMVNIPANAATNGLGHPNLAASIRDNIITFKGANRPTATLEQKVGQADPTLETPVYFTAIFDLPVSGFDASDLVLGGSANPMNVTVTEITPMDGTTYEIEVSGMTSNGIVTVSIPADRVLSMDFGLGNDASSSIDNEVEVIVNPPSNATLIDFQGVNIPNDGLQQNRTVQTNGLNGELPFDLTSPIWSHDLYEQANIYGGAWFTSTVEDNSILQLRTNDMGFEPNTFWCQNGSGTESDATTIDLLFLWKKEDFLNNMHLFQVGFDDDINNSSLSINVTGYTLPFDLRFVIQQDGVYYMSEFTGSVEGLISLTEFNNSDVVGKRWAAISPTANDFFIPNPLPTFQAVDFDNVEAVGFIYHGYRDSYSQYLTADAFQVNGVNTSPPLSVEWLIFEAQRNLDNQVELYWKTANERNDDYFIIQRSTNQLDWKDLKRINGKGEAEKEGVYNYLDQKPSSGLNYYRIKQVGADSRAAFSMVKVVDIPNEVLSIQMYPNPATTSFTLIGLTENSVVEILDVTGRVHRRVEVNEAISLVDIDIKMLESGMYLVQVKRKDSEMWVRLLVKA